MISSALSADEIILTDGRKISGTIVGMEKDSFRVETDYGFALIRKDKITRIDVTPKPSAPPPPPKVSPEAKPAPAVTPAAPPPVRKPTPPAIQERRPANGKIEEHVEGTTYINDSFGFQMYKPANWKVLADTARDIPSAVAAVGAADESTLLIVGTVRFEGPPSAYAAVLGASLKKIYSDYEVTPEEQISVADMPAIRHRFRGRADNKEWHGIVVNLADGVNHYGIIGLTSEGENFAFKQSVLTKMITSFQFRK